MTDPIEHSTCPQCEGEVPRTIGSPESGDQLSAERTHCPHCDAALVRDVEGHADRGWRLAEDT